MITPYQLIYKRCDIILLMDAQSIYMYMYMVFDCTEKYVLIMYYCITNRLSILDSIGCILLKNVFYYAIVKEL